MRNKHHSQAGLKTACKVEKSDQSNWIKASQPERKWFDKAISQMKNDFISIPQNTEIWQKYYWWRNIAWTEIDRKKR